MVSSYHFIVLLLVLVFTSTTGGSVLGPVVDTKCDCVAVNIPSGRICHTLPPGVAWGPCIKEKCPPAYECSPVPTDLKCKYIEIPTRVVKIDNGCDRIDRPYMKLVEH